MAVHAFAPPIPSPGPIPPPSPSPSPLTDAQARNRRDDHGPWVSDGRLTATPLGIVERVVDEPAQERTTALLAQLARGDADAQAELYGALCAELRSVAAGLMGRQDPGHTLQPTALVHEAWIRLVQRGERSYENRRHFLGVAAKAMRSILVDHVRGKRAAKRGGDMVRHGLDEAVACLETGDTDLLDLDAALEQLQTDDPELAHLVELRFFCGLTQADAAAALDVSVSTVERMWRIARAHLHRSLQGGPREERTR